MKRQLWLRCACLLGATFLVFDLASPALRSGNVEAQGNQPTRRVNVPRSTPGTSYATSAIFWLGKIGLASTYTDVRLTYDDTLLRVTANVVDHWLRYDAHPSPSDLTQWDAITLYLDTGGNAGSSPNTNAYRFDAQLNWYEPRDDWQTAYAGNGSGWITAPISFTTVSGWRGDGAPNDSLDDKGWYVEFSVPFASLGLDGPPPSGAAWGLAIAVHNRDDANGPALPDTVWPEWMKPENLGTWGQLHFGIPQYEPPDATPSKVVTIQQGLNGAVVNDGEVGGHTTCGADYGPSFWEGWGSANYAGSTQINIQNQSDVADWPCYSRYYATYPLDAIPNGKVIVSATLTMYLLGNAGGGVWGAPPDSYIQAFTVSDDWNESTLTWNNAPLANENIFGTWVRPKTTDYWPAYTWDVSGAVAEAYTAGKPLRLALYSADSDYHTGKYFSSSDWDEPKGRPYLTITVGDRCASPPSICAHTYLPFLIK